MTELFREYTPSYKGIFFRDWLAFRNQQDEFYIDKPCWVYVNDLITFWDCAADISLCLAKLASRLMEVPGNKIPGKQYNE